MLQSHPHPQTQTQLNNSNVTLKMSDLDRNQKVLIDMSNIGKHVLVCTPHGQIQDLVCSFKQRSKAELQACLRTVLRNVMSFDDDANWKQQESISCKTKRAGAVRAWENFCDDCVILQTLRLVLYDKQLVITSMDYRNTAAAPGTGLPMIKIRGKLKATLKKAVKNNLAPV